MWFILLDAGQHPQGGPLAPEGIGYDIILQLHYIHVITTIWGNPQGGPVATQQLLEGMLLDLH